jgi:hypothetical protein
VVLDADLCEVGGVYSAQRVQGRFQKLPGNCPSAEELCQKFQGFTAGNCREYSVCVCSAWMAWKAENYTTLLSVQGVLCMAGIPMLRHLKQCFTAANNGPWDGGKGFENSADAYRRYAL